MSTLVANRPEFAPPPQRGTGRALVLALIAHALLIAALTWGVRWKREGDDEAIEAEIWSSTPQQAAQRTAVTPPPTPTPPPRPAPPPPPPPPEVVKPAPAPPPPQDPDIALERERRQQELKRQQQAEKAAQDKREREAREREQERKEQAEAQRKQEQQKLAEQRKREDVQKAAQEKAAQEKAAQEKAAQQKAAQQKAAAAADEKERQANIARMKGLANGSASGTADQNSGPRSGRGAGGGSGISAGYFGRVAALIKRNVVFDPTSVSGNPEVVVKIETSPDGTIVGTPRIVKSSGNPAWDDAAIRAIQRTEVMPRDTDGRVPSPFPEIALRPKS